MAVNEHFIEWLNALRSGKIEQGTGYLHQQQENHDGAVVDQMCCLGVCSFIHKDALGTAVDIREGKYTVRYSNRAQYPDRVVFDFMGIPESHITKMSLGHSVLVTADDELMMDRVSDYQYFVNRKGGDKISVDILNDNGFSFNEIADLLEKEFVED